MLRVISLIKPFVQVVEERLYLVSTMTIGQLQHRRIEINKCGVCFLLVFVVDVFADDHAGPQQ